MDKYYKAGFCDGILNRECNNIYNVFEAFKRTRYFIGYLDAKEIIRKWKRYE